MRKVLFLLIALTFLCQIQFLFAQDYIVRSDGEIINCKITSLDSNYIYIDLTRNNQVRNTMIHLEDVQHYQYGGKRPVITSSAVNIGDDKITLKDGSTVQGTIIEQVPNQEVTIRTTQGKRQTYQLDEIERISKVELDLYDYGGKRSIGFALLGGGIMGVPVRYYVNPERALELGFFIRPYAIPLNTTTLTSGAFISGAINTFSPRRNIEHKRRIVQDGVSFKAGFGFAILEDIHDVMLTVNWIRERFKYESQKNSFIFELGGGLLYTSPFEAEKTVREGPITTTYYYETKRYAAVINIRFLWNLYD